jgi:hypothetical protein
MSLLYCLLKPHFLINVSGKKRLPLYWQMSAGAGLQVVYDS